MKIALVILHADPARGGAERYSTDLAAALARRGHQVALISSESLKIRGATRAGRYLKFLDALDQHLQNNAYDIVHAMLPVRQCDIYHPHAGMAAAALEKWNRFLNPRRMAMARVERQLLEGTRPPIVLSLSNYVRGAIVKYYSSAHIETLFNAVDLERFQPEPPAHARDYVNGLFIGQDFERKGLMQALVAASMLKEPRLKITVVGKRQAGFHPPPDAAAQVSFAGETSDPRAFYRDADFFVLPTRHDPCSLVVLEALAMGVPVISTRFNGATEIMTDGVHGYVLDDPDDVDALAGAMRKMMDARRRAEMAKACLQLRPRLSFEHHLDRLLEIYALRSRAHVSTARSSE
jgi:UDP-glucose:(heptosyl)LPS alpha-1,3-glucosyltransferase